MNTPGTRPTTPESTRECDWCRGPLVLVDGACDFCGFMPHPSKRRRLTWTSKNKKDTMNEEIHRILNVDHQEPSKHATFAEKKSSTDEHEPPDIDALSSHLLESNDSSDRAGPPQECIDVASTAWIFDDDTLPAEVLFNMNPDESSVSPISLYDDFFAWHCVEALPYFFPDFDEYNFDEDAATHNV